MRRLSNPEIKQLELELLLEFAGLCQRNNLYYTLGGGTLLGAIRHRGFIPWDDDIDILMPRPDYDRLMALNGVDLTGLPAHMEFRHWKDGGIAYPFIKLTDRRTRVEEKYVDDRFACKKVWIDIFPLDANPTDRRELARLYRLSLWYRKILLLKMARKGEGKTFLKRKLKSFLITGLHSSLFKRFSVADLCRRIDNLAKQGDFTASRYVGGIVWGYGPGERILKSSFLTPLQVEFEGHVFNAPSNYHEYLSGLYGDYMVLPPEKDRKGHEMKAFMVEEE